MYFKTRCLESTGLIQLYDQSTNVFVRMYMYA